MLFGLGMVGGWWSVVIMRDGFEVNNYLLLPLLLPGPTDCC